MKCRAVEERQVPLRVWRGSTGLALQVPPRPRKRCAHALVEGFPIALDRAGDALCKAAASHPPQGRAGEGRERASGYPVALQPALLPAQHIRETRMNLDANPAHRAVPLLDRVFFLLCDPFPMTDQISFTMACRAARNSLDDGQDLEKVRAPVA